MRYGEDYPISFQILTDKNSRYVSNFNCGNPSIDAYFHYEASTDKTSVTYLFIDEEADHLMACVTIACSAIFTDDKPKILSLFRRQEQQFSTLLSAMEVKYLDTDEKYQHIPYFSGENSPSLSDIMFDFMLNQMEEISHTKIGASKIVLYAVPSAVKFYKRHGFKEFGDAMYGDEGIYLKGCKPMYFDMN